MKNLSVNNLMFEGYVSHRYKTLINENRKEAEEMKNKGLISQEEYNNILAMDRTPNRKFSGWIARQLVKIKNNQEKATVDELKNLVTEFQALVNTHSIVGADTDLTRVPSLQGLKDIVDKANQQKTDKITAKRESIQNLDVLVDDANLYIARPNTHEASMALGKDPMFHNRVDNSGKPSCTWCVTYANDAHWKDYYDRNLMTLYFVHVKSPQMRAALKKALPNNRLDNFVVLTKVIGDPESESPEGKIDHIADADNHSIYPPETEKVFKIIGHN